MDDFVLVSKERHRAIQGQIQGDDLEGKGTKCLEPGKKDSTD